MVRQDQRHIGVLFQSQGFVVELDLFGDVLQFVVVVRHHAIGLGQRGVFRSGGDQFVQDFVGLGVVLDPAVEIGDVAVDGGVLAQFHGAVVIDGCRVVVPAFLVGLGQDLVGGVVLRGFGVIFQDLEGSHLVLDVVLEDGVFGVESFLVSRLISKVAVVKAYGPFKFAGFLGEDGHVVVDDGYAFIPVERGDRYRHQALVNVGGAVVFVQGVVIQAQAGALGGHAQIGDGHIDLHLFDIDVHGIRRSGRRSGLDVEIARLGEGLERVQVIFCHKGRFSAVRSGSGQFQRSWGQHHRLLHFLVGTAGCQHQQSHQGQEE